MNAEKNSEQELIGNLIKLVKKGDALALDKLLDFYIPQLKAFFRYIHVPESSIEDLVQETFEKMLNKIDSYDENKKFSSWLMTMGRNLYIDQYRRKLKGEEILASESMASVAPSPNPENEVLGKITVEELLKSLDEKERFIVEMRVFEKLSFGEISELTGTPEATLRSKFFRVMGKLRTAF